MNFIILLNLLSLLVYSAFGFPQLAAELSKRQTLPNPLPRSQDEGNDGPIPSLAFNEADQFVDVRPGTTHQFVAPSSTDKRGPCPGLNSAANHGFIPHNGILNTAQVVSGLFQAFSFGRDLSTALSAIAIALTGDPVAGTWSIGGPYPGSLLGLLSHPEGISYSHNRYEGDRSPTRMDAYLNNGDAFTMNMDRFKKLYFSSTNYTLDLLRDHSKYAHDYSVANNPYFFDANFPGIVSMGTFVLIPNLFSNHSSSNVQGYLDRETLKSFFSVTGPDSALVYTPGHEKIPQNWYKRSSANPLTVVSAAADLAISALKYPSLFILGGNTGTVNSFTPINLLSLTGGAFSPQTLLEGNNLGCFLFQAAQQAVPAALSGLVTTIANTVLTTVNNAILPITGALDCPALLTWNQNALNQYPGAGNSPSPS